MPAPRDGREIRDYGERITALEIRVDNMEQAVSALTREIGGTKPNGHHVSIRDKLHQIRGELEAIRLKAEALKEHREERRGDIGWKFKIALFAFAALAAFDQAVTLIERVWP